MDPKPLRIFFWGGGGTVGIGFENNLKHFWEVPIIFLGEGAKVFEKTLYPLPQK